MAQRDSELVIRLRDEASKTFEAIKKAGADFAAGMQDTSKTATATGSVFQRLAQSIVDLGKSANALAGVSKISDQLAKAAGAVESLEKKLAVAASEFGQFQARAQEAAAVTEAAAARAKAAEAAVTAQAKSVAALNAANKQNTQATKDADTALEKLTARLAKTKGGSDAMVAEAQKQAAALEALRAKQAQSQTGYDAEKVKLDALTAARKEATTAQGQAESAQNKANASLKTATGNIDNLTAGLGVARAGLAEIEGIFQASAGKAGLMTASVDALGTAQSKLKALTEAATGALRAQTDIGGPKASAAATTRLSDFQGALSRETARRAALAEAATRPTALAAPETARLVASAPAADATAAFRAQRQAVTDADAAYKTAQADLAALYRTMGEAGTRTIEQTVAIETQRAAIENSRAALARERDELIRFRDAARQASAARALVAADAAKQADESARQAAIREAASAEIARRQSAEDAARARAATVSNVVGGGGTGAGPASAATAAFREQKTAVGEARNALAAARTELETMQRVTVGVAGSTRDHKNAIDAQKAAVESAQAALTRESTTLTAMRTIIQSSAQARRDAARADAEAAAAEAAAARSAQERAVAETRSRLTAVTEAARTPVLPAAAPGAPTAENSTAIAARQAASNAFREQIAVTAAATRAYNDTQAALQKLYASMAAMPTATAEETAALKSQIAAFESSEAAMNREIVALREMREAISTTASARRSGVSADLIAVGSMSEIRAATSRVTSAVAEEVTILGALRNGLMAANAASREYATTAAQTSETHNALAGGIKNLVSAYVNVFLAASAFKSLISTAADTEAAQVRITTALGQGQEAGAVAFEHAASAARALKVDILPTVNAYGQFLGVVRDTPLEGRNATRVFDDLLVTIRAFKLAPENMTRVIQALTDIAARGHVATREMNQLDLALPVGLRQAIAQAAGFSANQMDAFTKAVHDGKIALDVLPAAMDIVANKARAGLPAAMRTAQSSFADFRNTLFDFKNLIANGDFMKGIIDGVNAINAVIKDPSASAGLRSIANGFGEILQIVALLLPQARILVIGLSGLTAVKLVSMVASFAAIRAAIVGIVDVIISWRAAFAILGASAVLPGIAAELGTIATFFFGPAGIIALIALAGAGFAYWVTGTKSAEDALLSYKQTMDRVRGALQQNGGDFKSIDKTLGGPALLDVEKDVYKQRDSYNQAQRALDGYVSQLQVLKLIQPGAGGQETAKLADLAMAYHRGEVSAADLKTMIDELNVTFTTEASKKYADTLKGLSVGAVDAATRLGVTSGTAREMGSKIADLETSVKKGGRAFDDFAKSVQGSTEMDRLGEKALADFGKAMDALAEKVPYLKNQLKELKEQQDISVSFEAGKRAIAEGYSSGKFNAQDVANETRILEARRDAAIAAQHTEAFEKFNTNDVSANREFLISRGGVTNEAVDNLHPDLVNQLTAAFKQAISEGIPLKGLSSGYRAPDALWNQGDRSKAAEYDMKGLSGHTYGTDVDVNLSGLNAAQTARVVEIFHQLGINQDQYKGDNPKEFNHFSILNTPLENTPELLKELQGLLARGAPREEIYNAISPKGQLQKNAESTNRDESKERNDAIAAQDATKKAILSEKELAAAEIARRSIEIDTAKFKEAHPNATAKELADEHQLLITKQQEKEIEADVAKFQDQHKDATPAQIAEFRQADTERHRAIMEAAQDNAGARDAQHDAIQGQEKLNALLTDRRALEKDLTVANESGDDTKIDAVTAKLASNRTEFDQTAESVRKFWNEVGGSSADAGIAKLDRTVDAANRVHGKFQIVGLSAKETQELVRDFANDISSAIDTFAQEVANGVKPIQALGDAFRKFASDFLLQIAKMIIQTQIFKLLGITQGGETTGGGLLGGLAGGGAAAGASGGGGGIFGFLGSLFGAHHTGGLVGSPTMFRTVSPLVFAGAKRYHTGGLAGLAPDEIPIIAKRNEEILTDDDPRHRDNQQGMAINNIVKQPKILNLWRVEDLMSAALNTPDGEKAIINYIRSNAGAVKGAIGQS